MFGRFVLMWIGWGLRVVTALNDGEMFYEDEVMYLYEGERGGKGAV